MTFPFMLTMVAAALLGGDGSLVSDAQLDSLGMYRYWQAEIPLASHDSIDVAYLADEALYVVTEGGSVFAIQADVGLIRWADKVTERDYRIQRPTHLLNDDGTGPVIIPTTTRTFVYDRFSGDLLQSFAPDFAAGGPAVGLADRAYFGSADGRVYSLLLNCSTSNRPIKIWTVQTDGPITTAPVLYNGTELLFASQSGTVYSCHASDKTLNWAVHLGGGVVSDPVVDESAVYVASLDRSVYKLDIETGKRKWRFQMTKELMTGPVVSAKTVFQFCPEQGLVAIDAETGKERWRVPYGRSFVSHTINGDFLFTGHRRLILVDHDSGEVRGEIDAPEVIGTVVNTRNDAVYLLGRHGRVQCARLDTVPYLRKQQVIAARAQLNSAPRSDWSTNTRGKSVSAPRDPLADDPLRSRRDLRP